MRLNDEKMQEIKVVELPRKSSTYNEKSSCSHDECSNELETTAMLSTSSGMHSRDLVNILRTSLKTLYRTNTKIKPNDFQ